MGEEKGKLLKVKGTLLLDFVKTIRVNKDEGWNKWLSPQDLELVNKTIVSSSWYPFDSFRNIGYAVFKETGNSSLDIAQQFGKFAMVNTMKIYEHFVKPGYPAATMDNFPILCRSFIKGDYHSEVTRINEKSSIYILTNLPPEEIPERITAFLYHMSGSIIALVEHAGGKNPKAEVKSENDVHTITVEWE
jgi:hypothetical protein